VTIENLPLSVKFWFGFLKGGALDSYENPGSRRQGGGGGEPR
jgi:hypothetical protein